MLYFCLFFCLGVLFSGHVFDFGRTFVCYTICLLYYLSFILFVVYTICFLYYLLVMLFDGYAI